MTVGGINLLHRPFNVRIKKSLTRYEIPIQHEPVFSFIRQMGCEPRLLTSDKYELQNSEEVSNKISIY